MVMMELANLAKGIAYLTIILAVVFLILANIKSNSSVTADGNATLAVNTLTDAAATIPGWVKLVILIAIAGLLIFLVSKFGQQ